MASYSDIVIAGAARTPIGAFNGAFASMHAHELGAIALAEALKRAKTSPEDVNEVIMGQILTAGAGMGPARQAAMAAGIPKERTAFSVNQLCGSGLRAVALGAQQIAMGDARIMAVGGQESMTMAPHCVHLRAGTKMGHTELVDTMIKDGLWDAFNGYHMGMAIENIVESHQISRSEQDEFAARSQQRAEAAQKAGKFKDEIVPVTVKTRKGDMAVADDEHPRHGTTVDALAKLRPAFKKDGTVTAGNASGINDGAAAVVLMSADEAAKRDVNPLGRIVSWAVEGVDPALFGIGPIPASRRALEKAGWTADELDLVESNEAFAAQACAVAKELGLRDDRLNVNGGAIALGHPIGASGARILVTLLYEMARRDAKRGLATLCVGGGMGIAMCVER